MDVREDNATETIKQSLLKARFPGVTVSMSHELHSEYGGQRDRVIRASDLKSVRPGFKYRSDN